MKKKHTCIVFFVFALGIVLSGCGSGELFGPAFTATPIPTPTPIPFNDEEFVEAAKEVCSSLKKEVDSLDPFILLDLPSKAEAYRQATDALAHLNITEQSAPLGTHFLSRMNDLISSFDLVGKAFSEAMAEAGLDESKIIIMITGDGTVYTYTGSVLELQKLDINNTLVKELLEHVEEVNEAAISLDLKDCTIETQTE